MDYKAASEKIRAYAKTLVQEMQEQIDKDQGNTVDRLIAVSLQLSWADSIRDQWQGFCSVNPELKAQMAIAEELMKQERYTDDPICLPPGMKPMVAMVDGKEAVSFEHSMALAMPLSAMFVNKVAEVMTAAANVADAAKQAEPKPDAGSSEKPTPAV